MTLKKAISTFEMGPGQKSSPSAQKRVCLCAGSALCGVCCEAVCFWSRVAVCALLWSGSAFLRGPLWAWSLLVVSVSGQLWPPVGSRGFWCASCRVAYRRAPLLCGVASGEVCLCGDGWRGAVLRSWSLLASSCEIMSESPPQW